MKKNIGISDRMVRFVLFDMMLGVPLSGIATNLPVWVQNTLFILSIYALITLIIGYSPLYHILGISTRDKKIEETT